MGNAGPQAPPGRMEGRTSDGGTAFVPEYGAFGASCLTAEPGAGTIVLLQPGSAGACFVHLRQSRLLDMFERSSRERNRKNRLGASLKTFSNCGFCLPAGEKRLGKGFSGWKAALNPALPGRNTAVRRETVIVLEGADTALFGKEVKIDVEPAATPVKKPSMGADAGVVAEADIKFGYCTEFIIMLENPLPDEEVYAFKDFLNGIGDSIVLVADDELVKVHVHTNDPGKAISKALTYGQLTRMKIDNMREEHQERLIKNAEKIAAQQAEEDKKRKEAAKQPPKENGFIAVSIGEGIKEIFQGLGVDYLIEGGQTMNPSTEDMLTAIEKVNAKNIFILPNNKNIILAANQAKAMTEDKNIIVVPTKTVPQGITAMISYVPEKSAEENEEAMTEGIQMVKTGQVTYAVRDTHIDEKEIHQGDIMGLGDHGLLAVGQDILTVAEETIRAMVDEDSELISIYYGEDMSEEDAESLGEKIEQAYPDCDVEVNYGGQPIYYCVVSVE